MDKIDPEDTHEKNKPNQKLRTGSLIAFVVGLVIIIISALIAHQHQLTGWQATIFHDINNENLSSGFTTAAKWITEGLGAGYPIAACVLIALLFKKFKLAWRFVFVTGGAGVVAEFILKPLVKEQRPLYLLHGIGVHARVLETDLGYPSGHVTEATAMAVMLWFLLPARWRWLSVVWILLVAWSRIYLGVHSPMDVIGGFGVGLAAASFLRILPNPVSKTLRLNIDDKHPAD